MFLPTNYKAPKSAAEGYMKLQDGENRIRILSSPILGWEDWDDKKPVRYRYENKPDKAIDPKKPVRHFWAMIVWNYQEEKVQILQISQAGIRKTLEKLCRDADWGEPFHYDIKILKEGVQKETEYSVSPIPAKPLPNHIIEEFNRKPCYLEALFEGQDPYDSKWDQRTCGMFNHKAPSAFDAPLKSGINKDAADKLAIILEQCAPDYKESVWQALHKNKITSLTELSSEMYNRILAAAQKKADENSNQELPF